MINLICDILIPASIMIVFLDMIVYFRE